MADENIANASYWFGRIEGKIDKLDEKLDHVAETVGRHDERIRSVEKRVEDLESVRTDDQNQKSSHWGALRAGLLSAVVSGLIGGLFIIVQILVK